MSRERIREYQCPMGKKVSNLKLRYYFAFLFPGVNLMSAAEQPLSQRRSAGHAQVAASPGKNSEVLNELDPFGLRRGHAQASSSQPTWNRAQTTQARENYRAGSHSDCELP